MESLSDDARAVLGAWFGMAHFRKFSLDFGMVKYKPSDRAQAGLDELVNAGFIERSDLNKFGGVQYILLREFNRAEAIKAAGQAKDFVLVQPIRPATITLEEKKDGTASK
jgi:hypothetical protein